MKKMVNWFKSLFRTNNKETVKPEPMPEYYRPQSYTWDDPRVRY